MNNSNHPNNPLALNQGESAAGVLLSELQARMRACRACLKEGHAVTPPAIFCGVHTARVMTIGQAPGITEVQANRPFNAGSGKRLFSWLAQAGIEESWFRSTQYMTSVTKCYPGRTKNGSGDRVPSRREQQLCRPFLDQEIQLVNPELVILVGRLAIELFFPRQPLEALVGTETRREGRWFFPLPHPSGASRWHQIPANRERIETAIRLIQRRFSDLFPEMRC